MSQPLLSGEVENPEVVRMRREIRGLEEELSAAKDEAQRLKQLSSDAVTAIRALRRLTDPFFMALKMIHGELSRVEAESVPIAGSANSSGGLSPKWEMLKRKLGNRESQIIDALQHGGMTAKQLTPVLHWDIKTVYRVTQKMKDAGLLNNDGGKFSLKEG